MASISVAGFATCPFHQQALAAAKKLVDLGIYAELDDLTCATRDEYQVWLKSDKPSLEDARAATHTSSPFVFSGEIFIGGCDDTLALLADSEAGRGSAPTRRLRAVASALVGCSAGGAQVAAQEVHPESSLAIEVLLQLPDGGEFGARVTGVDLANLLPGELEQLREAYKLYLLLHIPDQQHITPAEEAAFYRQLVPHISQTETPFASRKGIPGAEEISVIGHGELVDHHGVSGRINPTGQAMQWHPDGVRSPATCEPRVCSRTASD